MYFGGFDFIGMKFSNFFINVKGGVGMVLHLSRSHFINLNLGLDLNTNTKAKLLGIWALLFFDIQKSLRTQVVGDSKLVVDWLNDKYGIHNILLYVWQRLIKELQGSFEDMSI